MSAGWCCACEEVVCVVEGLGRAVCEVGCEVLIAREEEVVAAVGYGEEGEEGVDAQQP